MADMKVTAGNPGSRSGRQIIALVAPTQDDGNAHLIAAAPDLCAAVSQLMDWIGDDPDLDDAGRTALIRGRAALAKARGRQL